MTSKGMLTYSPNSAQERWHRANAGDGVTLLGAGVGIGKTEGLASEAVNRALENPGEPGLVASHVATHMKTVVRPRIIKKLREAGVFLRENRSDRQIFVKNGSVINYGSANRPESLEGADVAWVIGDELRFWPKESYDFFIARRRKKCPHPLTAFTSTLDSTHFMASIFKDTSETVIYGTTFENSANLQSDYVDRLKRALSDRLFRQYVLAEWMPSERAVFPEFSEKKHVRDFEFVDDHPVHVFFDPGQQRAAVLFAQHFDICLQHATRGCVHVFDEMQENATSTAWIAPKLKGLFNKHGWSMGKVYLDPAGRAKGTAVGLSDVDILESSGFKCEWTTEPARRDIRNGIELIRGKLEPVEGPPSLYFLPGLMPQSKLDVGEERGIVRSLQESEFSKGSGSRKDEPEKDGVLDHARDALRYGLVNLCEMPGTSWAGTY